MARAAGVPVGRPYPKDRVRLSRVRDRVYACVRTCVRVRCHYARALLSRDDRKTTRD